jgi:hypothetical protein
MRSNGSGQYIKFIFKIQRQSNHPPPQNTIPRNKSIRASAEFTCRRLTRQSPKLPGHTPACPRLRFAGLRQVCRAAWRRGAHGKTSHPQSNRNKRESGFNERRLKFRPKSLRLQVSCHLGSDVLEEIIISSTLETICTDAQAIRSTE